MLEGIATPRHGVRGCDGRVLQARLAMTAHCRAGFLEQRERAILPISPVTFRQVLALTELYKLVRTSQGASARPDGSSRLLLRRQSCRSVLRAVLQVQIASQVGTGARNPTVFNRAYKMSGFTLQLATVNVE
jgi:hypothetical protein